MPISNQYPSVVYGISGSGGLIPIGTLQVGNGGELIIIPSSGAGNQPGSFFSNYNSAADVQAIATAGGAGIAGTIIPAMNINAPGKLDFYQLQAGGAGAIVPNDYNAATNNISWYQVL